MDGVLPAGAAFGRRESFQSEISVESDVTYRSLENGDISAMVGGPHKMPNAALLESINGSTRSLVSMADGPGGSASGQPMVNDSNSRVVYVNDPSKNFAVGFCDNKVVTAKYTKLNFIPRFFYGRLSQVRA